MNRQELFEVEGGALKRTVVPARGRRYEHRCQRASFEAVAHAIEERGDAGATLEEIVRGEDLPHSQVAVAVAFLKERGCVVPIYKRRFAPAGEALHLDAMIEFCVLAEGGAA